LRTIRGPRSPSGSGMAEAFSPRAMPAAIIAPVEVPAVSRTKSVMRTPSASSSTISARVTITPRMPPPSTARAIFWRKGFSRWGMGALLWLTGPDLPVGAFRGRQHLAQPRLNGHHLPAGVCVLPVLQAKQLAEGGRHVCPVEQSKQDGRLDGIDKIGERLRGVVKLRRGANVVQGRVLAPPQTVLLVREEALGRHHLLSVVLPP